jgi:hypothetical protein
MDSVALQKITINKATAFGATVDVSLLAMNLEANMEYAQSHEWGRQFRVSSQAISKKYPAGYSHHHDQTLYDNMLKEYAAADHVRVLHEALTPSNEQANQVRAFSGQLVTLQRAFDNYEERDSGRSKKNESKKKKKRQQEQTRTQRGQREQEQHTLQPIVRMQQVDRALGEKQMQTLQ